MMFFFFVDFFVIKNVIYFNELEVIMCLDYIRCGYVCFVFLIFFNLLYYIIEICFFFLYYDFLYCFIIKGL